VGVYRFLNTPEFSDDTDLEPIPDVAEAPDDEDDEEIVG
jgi:hypothetical protein